MILARPALSGGDRNDVAGFSPNLRSRIGEVYAESGPREESLENLKKAETMFQEMGMDYWLGRAQDALTRLFSD